MSLDELGEFLKNSIEESQRLTAHLPKPIASVHVSSAGMSIDVCLDTSRGTYSDWIKGEGSDIDLKRDMKTKMVAGAHLPLYAKTLMISGDNFPTIRIDMASGKVEVEQEESPTPSPSNQ